MIVRFPDGTAVQATGAGRPEGDPPPDFGLYLDNCWAEPRQPWDHVVVEWPDFGLPPDAAGTGAAIRSAFERAKSGERVEVGCHGGMGRTGTVLACMAVLAGVPAPEAVDWVRSAYRRQAVETDEQRRFVEEFAATQS